MSRVEQGTDRVLTSISFLPLESLVEVRNSRIPEPLVEFDPRETLFELRGYKRPQLSTGEPSYRITGHLSDLSFRMKYEILSEV